MSIDTEKLAEAIYVEMVLRGDRKGSKQHLAAVFGEARRMDYVRQGRAARKAAEAAMKEFEPAILALAEERDRLAVLSRANNDLARHEANGRRQLQAENARLREALDGLLSLYDDDEGCRSLPQYIAARAALSPPKVAEE